MHRGGVSQRGRQRGCQIAQLDPDTRSEPGPNGRCCLRSDLGRDRTGSFVTSLPAGTRPAFSAARLTSLGVMRPNVDRYAH
jgi:hypothetical protein